MRFIPHSAIAALASTLLIGLPEPLAGQQAPSTAPEFKDERRLPGSAKHNKAETKEESNAATPRPEVRQPAIEREPLSLRDDEPRSGGESGAYENAAGFADQEAELTDDADQGEARRAEKARHVAAEIEAKRVAQEEARRRQPEGKRKGRSPADHEVKRQAAVAEANRKADEEAQHLAAELEARRQAASARQRLRTPEISRQSAEANGGGSPEPGVRERGERQAHRFATAAPDGLADQDAAPAEANGGAEDVPRARRHAAVHRKAAEPARFTGIKQRRPAAAPGSAPGRSNGADRLVARGQELLSKGNVRGARALFQRAAQAGSAEGALELGATYDPAALRQLGPVGVPPDKAAARRWYTKARELGDPSAQDLLHGLNRR